MQCFCRCIWRRTLMSGVRASVSRGVGAGSSLVVHTWTRWRMRLSVGMQVCCSARMQRTLEPVFLTVSFHFLFFLWFGKKPILITVAISFFDRTKGSASTESSEPSLINMQPWVSTSFRFIFLILPPSRSFFRAACRGASLPGEPDGRRKRSRGIIYARASRRRRFDRTRARRPY
jgi:hypothetical protein